MLDTQTQLAGMTVICNCGCHTDGGFTDWRGCCEELHGASNNPGRVYLFGDEVRILCRLTYYKKNDPLKGWIVTQVLSGWPEGRFQYEPQHPEWCRCQGRGWIAVMDGWTWWRAIASTDFVTDVIDEWLYQWRPDIEESGYDPEVVFFVALLQIVKRISDVEVPDAISK